MRILAVSGYKPPELGIFQPDAKEIEFIKMTLKKRLLAFVEEGGEWLLSSGQPGVEQWAVEAAIELQNDYAVGLAIFPPFEGQESIWPEIAQERYAYLKEAVDHYQPLYQGGYDGPYQLRAKNDFLVDKSEGLLLLYDEDQPGSPRFMLEAARRKEQNSNYSILFITPDEVQDTISEYEWEHAEASWFEEEN
ncbi:SLOG family protein [Salsuginibacillus kocurii]|uniref:SLOG family protein n=1 Tax=Salsuginibacillus kocurii TaxID=427078 RepID=UPI00037D3C1B|nr:SLOG family protein [Salsuginibacillus kocurii]